MEQKAKIVATVIKKCLGYRKGERLLILTDDKLEALAEDFYSHTRQLGVEAFLIKMAPRTVHGEEPPQVIAQALKSVDLALLITDKSLSHTKARKVASKKYGVRIASLPGLTRDMLKRSILIDYNDLKSKVARLTTLLSQGKSVQLTTDRGTDLSFSIKGRCGFRDDGLYVKRGAFGNLPAGEASIAPLEGTANGRLIVDASVAPLGRLTRPMEIVIKDGYAQKISSKKFRDILNGSGKDAFNIAEFGIGLNPKAKVTGNVLEDEKAVGTAHIAFGDNESFGGRVSVPCHLDAVFFNPEVTIDGKKNLHLANYLF